jgi:hypothetical protein
VLAGHLISVGAHVAGDVIEQDQDVGLDIGVHGLAPAFVWTPPVTEHRRLILKAT